MISENSYEVERVLAVFDNLTDEHVTDHALIGFDLEKFTQHFKVADTVEPLMYDCYPVNESDVAYLSDFLTKRIEFDFDRFVYSVECFCKE